MQLRGYPALGLLALGYCDIPNLSECMRLRVRAHHVFVAGLVGSMNAEQCVRKKLLEEVLSEYGLSFSEFSEDVVAATSDGGAFLMKK